jgi:Flp pilus assembly pilin Flp
VGRERSERGAVLVEFALLMVFVGVPLLLGGLFVFLDVLAKTQATGATPAAANFLAAGGCPTSGACANPTCAVLPPDLPPGATRDTICEIEQIMGNSLIDTEPSTLEVDIYCTPVPQPGNPCTAPGAVWACVRAWNSNFFNGIIAPRWISSESEQVFMPLPPGPGGSSTTTYIPNYPTIDFEPYSWPNQFNGTGDMACGS